MVQLLERETVGLSPDPIYNIALGFAASKTLLTAEKLGVFEFLNTGAKSLSEIAADRGLSERGAEILLDTCVALKLCRKEGALYANTALAEHYLVPNRPGYLGRFLAHFDDHMYPAWLRLEEAVRTGHAQIAHVFGERQDHFFQAIDRQEQDLETFMMTMEEHSLLEGAALAKAYDFSAHHQMLDVAGGTGAMSVAILRANPHLQSIVFDRPPVCQIAEKSIRKHGLSDRIRVQPGDMFKDALPQGADVVLLSAILHNWSPDNAKRILRQCHAALKPGGRLLVNDQVLNDDKTGPLPGLLCSLNMMVMIDGAQEYSRLEFDSFLKETGFALEEIRSTEGVRQLLIARRL